VTTEAQRCARRRLERRDLCCNPFIHESSPQQPQDHAQHHAYKDRRRDRQVEGEVVALDDDVAGQPSQPQLRQPRPQQADDDQHDPENDEPASDHLGLFALCEAHPWSLRDRI